MTLIPDAIWLAHAVATRSPRSDERIVIVEGSLEHVVDTICDLPPRDRTEISISFPGREAEPFGYEAEMIPVLMREWLGG